MPALSLLTRLPMRNSRRPSAASGTPAGGSQHPAVPVAVSCTARALLLHGTSTVHLESIATSGLLDPYLTSSPATASYHAECCAEEDTGQPVTLAVLAPCGLLAVDVQALEETVFADPTLPALYQERARRERCSIEEALWSAANRACASSHADGWGSLDWRTSLALTGCCRLRAPASAVALGELDP